MANTINLFEPLQQKNIEKILPQQKQSSQTHQQVLITARIVSINYNYLRKLGISFISHNQLKHNIDTKSGEFLLPLAHLSDQLAIDAKLDALEQQGLARIIAKPELITLNNQQASIESGEEVPYQESTLSGATSVSFKKAVIQLQVTPKIISSQTLLLKLKISQDKVSSLTVHGVPAINTQRIVTHAYVNNRHTIILGGIIEQTTSLEKNGIPILQSIPVLGVLFRDKKQISQRKELFIFLTPKIL